MVCFDNSVYNSLTYIAVLVTAFYLWCKHKYNYWARKGIEFVEPSFFGGNLSKTLLMRENPIIELKEACDKIQGKYGGIFMLINPVLMLKDPEMIKQILVKDFDYFTDRGFYVNEKVDPLTDNLLMVGGEKWRKMRQKLTPAFTTGKLKQMIPIFMEIGRKLQDSLLKVVNSEENKIEARDLMSRYTVDSITSLAFGLEIDSINNPDEPFRRISRKIAEPNLNMFLRSLIASMAPKFADIFKIKSTDIEIEEFLRSVTKQSLDLRENKNVIRDDFMQILIQLRNQGSVNYDGALKTNIVEGMIYAFYG